MSVLPPNGADYAQMLRGAGHAWWRSLLGVALALGGLLFVTALINQGLVALAWVMTGRSQELASYARQAYAFERPSGVLAAGLAVAALAPISWLLVAVLHRMRPRWLSSVRPRLRWGYLLVALGIALVVFLGAQWLFALIEPRGAWVLRPGVASFVVIILLVTPLQAAAEEVFFRGYLLQAFGSLASGPWVGIGLSALVFAALHGGQSPAMFSDRLALGLLAGVLVWRTGGLEAAIAAHVVSNVYTYLNGALTSSVAAVRATQEISWLDAVFDVGVFAVFTVAALLVARRQGLPRRVLLSC